MLIQSKHNISLCYFQLCVSAEKAVIGLNTGIKEYTVYAQFVCGRGRDCVLCRLIVIVVAGMHSCRKIKTRKFSVDCGVHEDRSEAVLT